MALKTLTFFALPSPDGQELAHAVAQTLGPKYGFQVTVKQGATQDDFFQAALADDVVVADATLLDEGENNYPIFTLQQISFDHILMVSRSYVPLNMMALQEGGIPAYPFPARHPEELAGNHQGSKHKDWRNHKIIEWLDQKLAEWQEPRPEKIAYIPGETGLEMLETYVPQMKQAMERAEQRKRQEYQVFISYRSRDEKGVKELVTQLESGMLHEGQPKKALYLQPGSLAYDRELLPKMRRWMLLAIIDRKIAPCEELIIYNTPDYLNSWWTQGELITIAYRRNSKPVEKYGSEGFSIKVSLYDPKTGTLGSGEHLVPEMNDKQAAKMARYYAHSDPLTLGPESTEGIRMIRDLFKNRWVGWFFKWQFKRRLKNPKVRELLRQSYPVEQLTDGEVKVDDIFAQMDGEGKFETFVNDEVFSDEYLYHPILEIGRKVEHTTLTPEDVDSFLSMETLDYKIFTPAQLQVAQEQGILVTAEGKRYKMVNDTPPRCLWYPSRRGQVRKECFEILPVYVAID